MEYVPENGASGTVSTNGSANGHSTTAAPAATATLPVALVPTPSQAYRTHRKINKVTVQPGPPPRTAAAEGPFPVPPIPLPHPILTGPRLLIYKQDPTVTELGIRRAFLPRPVSTGPRDTRITSQGLAPVTANAFGDFIQTPGSDAFDAVHTFAVVRMTLTMAQRALASTGNPVPWQWNSPSNTEPLTVRAHGLPGTMNAFYSRSAKELRFGDFNMPGTVPPQRVFTCRSLDIVAHETGHAILDGLKPGWLLAGNPPQTGGLHESFGDLTAIFLTLSQLDQVEAIIAYTKANLHNKNFLSDLAEEFGLALGRANGLRNADNDLKLSEVGTEVHAISQVFTGGIYDVLADIFALERNVALKDDAKVLYDCGQYLYSLLLRAIVAAPASGTTYAHVVNQMLTISNADGKPASYRAAIRNRFTFREVVAAPTPLSLLNDEDSSAELMATDLISASPDVAQDRSGCCGTMKLYEYIGEDEMLAEELDEFTTALKHLGHAGGRAPKDRKAAAVEVGSFA